MTKQKCLKCKHEWTARVEEPTSCPNCKRYDWNKKENKDGKRD